MLTAGHQLIDEKISVEANRADTRRRMSELAQAIGEVQTPGQVLRETRYTSKAPLAVSGGRCWSAVAPTPRARTERALFTLFALANLVIACCRRTKYQTPVSVRRWPGP